MVKNEKLTINKYCGANGLTIMLLQIGGKNGNFRISESEVNYS